MNKVILMGRLAKDPEVRYTANNVVYTTFTLAVNRRFSKDQAQSADFINVVAWNKTAEFVSMYFKKGQQVAITGRLQVSSYEKDGQRVWRTDVVAEDVFFADSKKENYGEPTGAPKASKPSNSSNDSVDFSDFSSDEFTIATDDDITF